MLGIGIRMQEHCIDRMAPFVLRLEDKFGQLANGALTTGKAALKVAQRNNILDRIRRTGSKPHLLNHRIVG